MLTLNPISIKIIPIFLSLVYAFILGSIWYGPLFGKAWMREVGLTPEDISRKKANRAMMIMPLYTLASLFALALLLNFSGARTIPDALGVAAVIAVGICATGSATNALYENRSIKYVLITQGYNLLHLIGAAVLITIWK